MSRPLLLGLAAVAFLAAAHLLHAQVGPTLDGYVTQAGAADSFYVDGIHVTCKAPPDQSGAGCRQYAYGQHLAIYGKRDKHSDTITAQRIDPVLDADGARIVGFALIDGILSPTLIRADGYAMQLTEVTKQVWNPPLTATSKPTVNQWIEYEGLRHGNTIALRQISFFPGNVTAGEQKLRNKTNFDASTVTEDDRQSKASKLFKGVDYKRIPAVHDAEMQTRINNIGQRLIPKWQTALPAGDPNKVDFRFQLVDATWPDCMTMPSGVSLVPLAGNEVASHTIKRRLEDQSGRVSLVLLHDAGFDIHKAPLAWWRLSARQPDFMSRPVPHRAAYLFDQLATDWSSGSPFLVPQG